MHSSPIHNCKIKKKNRLQRFLIDAQFGLMCVLCKIHKLNDCAHNNFRQNNKKRCTHIHRVHRKHHEFCQTNRKFNKSRAAITDGLDLNHAARKTDNRKCCNTHTVFRSHKDMSAMSIKIFLNSFLREPSGKMKCEKAGRITFLNYCNVEM